MRQMFHVVVLTVIIGISLAAVNSKVDSTEKSKKKYPIICKTGLGIAPEKASLKKVDVNSDGLIDIIAKFPWGGSGLYLNCKKGRYYYVIRSNGKLCTERVQKNGWIPFTVDSNALLCDGEYWLNDRTTIIDGKIFHPNFLPFEFENEPPHLSQIRFDGLSYKFLFDYCKSLDIYAPRYRFVINNKQENKKKKEVNTIYEVVQKTYKLNAENPSPYTYGKIFYTDLNNDRVLDAVLEYSDIAGSGAQTYAGLLLNCGDNSFFYAGEVVIGPAGTSLPQLQSQEITVGGSTFTAIVYKQTPKEVVLEEEELQDSCAPQCYDLYLYQPTLKIFLYMEAKPGRDKSTFIPVDQKKYEYILNPPVLRDK